MYGFDAYDVPTSGKWRTYRLLIPDADWWIEALNTVLSELANAKNWTLNGNADLDYCERSGAAIEESIVRSVELIGMIFPYGGAILPFGCLWCDGSEVAQADYPDLYTLIGSTYGAADAGNFRLPDLRGRAPIGAGAGAGLTPRSLADQTGEEKHTLTSGEMPSHSHIDTGHSHTIPSTITFTALTGEEPVNIPVPIIPSFTGTSSANLANSGGDGAHNTMQPSLALNFVIVAAAG